MPPKKLPRLEKGQTTLFGSASSEGAHRKAPRHREHSELLGWSPSLKTSCWLSSCAKLGQCNLGKAARPRVVLASNRKPLPNYPFPPPYPPLSWLLPTPQTPTHQHTLSLSQSLTLFPPLLLPLPISHPLIFCPPLHNLHLSSQLLPAFTVFKQTF